MIAAAWQHDRLLGAEALHRAVDVQFAPAGQAQHGLVAVVAVEWGGSTRGQRLAPQRELAQAIGIAGLARLHLGAVGAELTVLSKDQASYIGVNQEGPYKAASYRY